MRLVPPSMENSLDSERVLSRMALLSEAYKIIQRGERRGGGGGRGGGRGGGEERGERGEEGEKREEREERRGRKERREKESKHQQKNKEWEVITKHYMKINLTDSSSELVSLARPSNVDAHGKRESGPIHQELI